MYIYSEHDNLRKANFSFGITEVGCMKRYESNPLDTFNKVEITHLETSQTVAFDQWISGTFQFRMMEIFDGGCGDTIYITDGRFDLRYQAI